MDDASIDKDVLDVLPRGSIAIGTFKILSASCSENNMQMTIRFSEN